MEGHRPLRVCDPGEGQNMTSGKCQLQQSATLSSVFFFLTPPLSPFLLALGVQILLLGISSIPPPMLVLCLEALLCNLATGTSYTVPSYLLQLEDSKITQVVPEDTRDQVSLQNHSWCRLSSGSEGQ